MTKINVDHLKKLESKSIFILREAYANFQNIGMLWSMGKDSTVLLWLVRKAFFGHVPFPLIHIDTSYKIPEMIAFRDRLAMEWKLTLLVGRNEAALAAGTTFPQGKITRTACCELLKTIALRDMVMGTGQRRRLDLQDGTLKVDSDQRPFYAILSGIRADEEGSRSKERYFSPRTKENTWNIASQPPEFWNHFKIDFAPGTHLRIHPLLDWTEINIWEYIHHENIPTVPLYFDQGKGVRYRSLGCMPCTFPIQSTAKTPEDIIEELTIGKLAKVAERSGRGQDQEGNGTLEVLRKTGYM